MSLSGAVLMGVVSAIVILIGGHRVVSGEISPGDFVRYTVFLGLLVAPIF